MKKILLSVHPKWCKMIFNGKKTIEVRRTRPKLEPPFEVLVYCTKHKLTKTKCMHSYLHKNEPKACGERGVIETWSEIGDVQVNFNLAETYRSYGMHGKVIGSFVCDRVEEYEGEFWDDDTYERIQEPWEPSDFAEYGEYEYDTIGENGEFYGKGIELSKQSCLSWNELRKYVGQGLKDFYGWHITEPKLFDKPKELSEFGTVCNRYENDECDDCPYLQVYVNSYPCDDCVDTWCGVDNIKPLTCPPQSWCYVEER